MGNSRKGLFIALLMIVAGVVTFFAFLAAIGADPDQHPLGLFEWVVGGVLIAPGFAYLIRWKKAQNAAARSGG